MLSKSYRGRGSKSTLNRAKPGSAMESFATSCHAVAKRFSFHRMRMAVSFRFLFIKKIVSSTVISGAPSLSRTLAHCASFLLGTVSTRLAGIGSGKKASRIVFSERGVSFKHLIIRSSLHPDSDDFSNVRSWSTTNSRKWLTLLIARGPTCVICAGNVYEPDEGGVLRKFSPHRVTPGMLRCEISFSSGLFFHQVKVRLSSESR